MEEVLLGSMSNTVSISSSGCSSGERCRGSQSGGVHPLLPPSPNLHLGLLLPWRAMPSSVFPDLQPRAQARGDRKRPGMLVALLNVPTLRTIMGASKESWDWDSNVSLLGLS